MNTTRPPADDPPSRSKASLSSAFALFVSGLWLVAAAAGFVGFFVWYFMTLEEGPEKSRPAVYVPEIPERRIDGSVPGTGVLLRDLDTKAAPSFRAGFFGHPSKHCAVRVNVFHESSAFVIVFIRMGEYFFLDLPLHKYEGMVACGAAWDAQDFSFVGVLPKVYREGDFFTQMQPGHESGVHLGGFWDMYGDGQ